MEKQLEDLVQRLSEAFGDRIVSVILYGSAAAGDWQERASDLNILCVLRAITATEIKLSARAHDGRRSDTLQRLFPD
jgi:predicted nucleotidyltransferase